MDGATVQREIPFVYDAAIRSPGNIIVSHAFGFDEFRIEDGTTSHPVVVPPEVRGPENPFFQVEVDAQGDIYSAIVTKDSEGSEHIFFYRYRDDAGTSLRVSTDQKFSTYALESTTSMLGIGADANGRSDGTLYRLDLDSGIAEVVFADSRFAGMNSLLYRSPDGDLFGLTADNDDPNRLFRLDLDTREFREVTLDFTGLGRVTLLGINELQAGDANQNLEFDQLDLVQVQIAAKYLTGLAATWGEGDWDGAPGGTVGSPPVGDGLFNQFDVIAAQQAGIYLTGPYGAVRMGGQENDGQTSVLYDSKTGEIAVDAPAGTELTSINIDSAAGIFTRDASANLGGSFDNDADNNIFKATFGGSFGSLSFGIVAQTGLAQDFILGDLTVIGSLQAGGALGNVDLIYVPEPSSVLSLILGTVAFFTCLGVNGRYCGVGPETPD